MVSLISIYTDGACKKNPGKGGWAFIAVKDNEQMHSMFGSEVHTTNNRMEMTAAIKALEYVRDCWFAGGVHDIYEIVVDSKYVYDGITSWIPKWKNNNWKTSVKKDVLNSDLWKEMDLLYDPTIVKWRWVKGHSGDNWNDVVDEIASNAAVSA